MNSRPTILVLPIALLIAIQSASHAITFWDGSNTSSNAAVDGGSGTWDSSTTNWTDAGGTTNTAWSDGQRAVFTGTAGTVTIANGFTAAPTEIEFADVLSGSYILTAAGSGGINNTGNLLVILGDNTTATIAAPISGSGNLELSVGAAGTNVLYLTGTNTYTGTTTLNGGSILSIGDGGTTGSITSDVDLAGAGSQLWFGRSNDYTYTGTISGMGSVSIVGYGNTTFTAAQTYTGGTTIETSSNLYLGSSASILGTTSVDGRLGGNGYAETVNVSNVGTLSPGMANSIGTLSIGDLTLVTGSTTEIGMSGPTAGSQHDQIVVTNTADLAGTLSILLSNGYTPNTGDFYDVMLADTFNGDYDSITSSNALVYFTSDIIEDDTDILRLTATNTALQPRTLSYNARQMAGAIDGERLGGFGSNFEPYLTDWIAMSDSDLDAAMLQLSPHQMASMLQTNLQFMQNANTNFNNRMAIQRRFGLVTVARQPMSTKSESTLVEMDPTRYGAWVEGTGSLADIDSLGYSVESGAGLAGIDYQINPELIAGFFAGYHEAENDLNSMGSEIEIEGSTLGAYGHYRPKGSDYYYQGMASFGVNDYSTRRNFMAGPDTFNARGDTDGIQYDLNGTAGWERDLGDYLLTVEGGLRYAKVEADGYSETGAAPFNIAYLDQDAESFQSVITTRISREHEIVNHKAVSELRVGWRHEFMDQALTTSGSFIGGANSPFAVRSPEFGEDTAELGIGTTLLINDSSSVSLGYDTQLSSDHSSHNLSAMLRYNW